MQILRTPDERFEGLVDYPFAPHYTTIQTHDGTDLRIHHLDEGPIEGPVMLVDDVPDAEWVREFLSDAGMDVSTAQAGRGLLKHISDVTPDIILIDIESPDRDMRQHSGFSWWVKLTNPLYE